MDCIFLNHPRSELHFCHVQPIRLGEDVQFYKATPTELKKFCEEKKLFHFTCNFPLFLGLKDFIEEFDYFY